MGGDFPVCVGAGEAMLPDVPHSDEVAPADEALIRIVQRQGAQDRLVRVAELAILELESEDPFPEHCHVADTSVREGVGHRLAPALSPRSSERTLEPDLHGITKTRDRGSSGRTRRPCWG